jgi:hypothetical protein
MIKLSWSLIAGLLFLFGGNVVLGQNDFSWRTSVSDNEAKLNTRLISNNQSVGWQGLAFSYELDSLPVSLQTGEVYCSVQILGENLQSTKVDLYYHLILPQSPQMMTSKVLTPFHEDIPTNYAWRSELFSLKKERKGLVFFGLLKSPEVPVFDSLIINFFKPDPDFVAERPIAWAMSRVEARDNDCGCPLPQHITRTGWGCPDGQNPSCANPVTTQVTHLIVHHSATSNTSANWANTVRSIWNYHTGTNGWCDIGYNWLIDPNGVIYQGRGGGDNIRGAHFCGTNSNTMGICLLGDYRVDTPSAPMMRSLERLLAWKGCKEQLAVLDTGLHAGSNLSLPHVTGHRLGCNTTCPGDEVYNRLSFVRSNTVDSIAACPIISSVDEFFTPQAGIFPNPASDHIILEYNAPLDRIQLFNSLGQLVKNISPEKRRISLSGLPPGKYFLRCTKDDAQRSFPFLLP